MQQLSFRIDCVPAKRKEVLQLLDSLLKLGAIRGYSKTINWIDSEGATTEDELLAMVKESKNVSESGLTYSTEEAKTLLSKWQLEKR